MKDDTTSIINNAQCYVINNSSSVYAYRSNVRYTYTLIGSKWYNTAQQQYANFPTNTICFPYSDIAVINSHQVFEPIYVCIAFIFVVFVWLLWFNVFKRLTRWKL